MGRCAAAGKRGVTRAAVEFCALSGLATWLSAFCLPLWQLCIACHIYTAGIYSYSHTFLIYLLCSGLHLLILPSLIAPRCMRTKLKCLFALSCLICGRESVINSCFLFNCTSHIDAYLHIHHLEAWNYLLINFTYSVIENCSHIISGMAFLNYVGNYGY